MNPDFERNSYEKSFADAHSFLDEVWSEMQSLMKGIDAERREHATEIEVLTTERDNALLELDRLTADNEYLANAVLRLQQEP